MTKPSSRSSRHARPIRRRKFILKNGIAAPGGGSTAFVPVPLEWRGTTRQVCGLFPWASPGQLPLEGAPIGRHQKSRAVICFDHVSWFLAHRIANPSVLIIAKPGLGKSTLASKLMLWLAALGYIVLIPGDTKPDYVEFTRRLGGDHRVVARSGGAALNPCDPGGMAAAAARIGGAAGATLLAEAIGKATVCISALVELGRKGPVADYEEAAISACLRLLYTRNEGAVPVLREVVELLETRPNAVRAVILDRGVDEAYDRLVDPLQRSLRALLDGQFGDVFARRVQRTADRPPVVNIDTSRIKAGDPRFLAAVMIAAWSDMYGMVEADQALADEGLAPRRLYCLTLDELWRVLRLGGTMPDRVNELTRLNRTQGVGQIMITHSIRDLAPGRNSEIEGIEERAGAIVIGGVPKKELIALDSVVTLTNAEQNAIREWWSTSVSALERNEVPPGAGKFLIKASSEDPGIPVDVVLTSAETEWGGQNTNKVWGGGRGAGDAR
ncbi:hypothetical protein [Jatrophihabitans lederbergiae]|uniref:ATP/GTP-binding protein n=1 Tax=Jatrophihabitans lederbergiae TaxID=3075547 RepID=A0ABU2JCQ6_9ACTN|nr:hypothetical protein [Jatrophihabitans sp. DSM 44399]MDT0262464.1 hypothetical protein [Jatrophihabitans sp. DSM 44399]